MTEITGLEVVFENCEQFSIKAGNIKELQFDHCSTKDLMLPDSFFGENIFVKHFNAKLSYDIGSRLLHRLYWRKDITYIRILSGFRSTYIEVPYYTIDKNNKILYVFKKIVDWFKNPLFVGDNVCQKNKCCNDYFQITISQRSK